MTKQSILQLRQSIRSICAATLLDETSKERAWCNADSASGVCSKSCCPMGTNCGPRLGGDTHVPDKVLSIFEPHTESDSQGQDREAERVRQARHHSRIGTSDHHGVQRPCETPSRHDSADRCVGSPPDHLRACPRSGGRQSWLQLGDQRTGRDGSRCPPRGACRVEARNLPRGAPTNANAGSVADNAGASAVKVGPVCSNAVMVSTVVATMARRACSGG